jgi:phenylacetate-CoA ligase
MSADAPTDDERYPELTAFGRQMLTFLTEHPSAPIFRNQSGHRLLPEDVALVRAFEREASSAPVAFSDRAAPAWVADFVARAFAQVPHYRSLGSPPTDPRDVPPVDRGDLSRDITRFVPDDVPLDRLINFKTSGTTGHPLLIASHPIVAASYLAFHKRALARFGVELRHGRRQVGVVLIGHQRKCFTYVSVTPTQNECGLAKINLHPADWRDPADREKYLDALAPEVYAGDPISLSELLELPLATRPRALLSTSMALSRGLRERLEQRFECPVLDLYSLNEAGPIGVYDAAAGGHVLLQHRMWVEILDPDGHPLPLGERGEVTLTGGFNFCLPLIRYRTGDHAALCFVRGEPVLVELAGRPAVRFRTAAGEWINNIDVTHALDEFAIPQFSLRQDSNGVLRLALARRTLAHDRIAARLAELFGNLALEIVEDVEFDGKVVQYASGLEGSTP